MYKSDLKNVVIGQSPVRFLIIRDERNESSQNSLRVFHRVINHVQNVQEKVSYPRVGNMMFFGFVARAWTPAFICRDRPRFASYYFHVVFFSLFYRCYPWNRRQQRPLRRAVVATLVFARAKALYFPLRSVPE